MTLRSLPLKWLLVAAWVGVALLAIVGLAQTLRWGDVVAAIQTAQGAWVAVAAGTLVVTQLLKAWRWRYLLHRVGIHPSWREIVTVQLIGQGLNTFLPIRVGEVARIQWMASYDRVLVLSTITLEKSADLICFALLAGVVVVGAVLPDWVTTQFNAFAISSALAIVGVIGLLVVSRERWVLAVAARLPWKWVQAVAGWYLRFRQGWRQVAHPQAAFTLLALSGAIWLSAISTNVCLLLAFGLPASWMVATVLLVILQIGITVATLPATIGIFEYLCVLTLGWFGISASVALGFGVLLHCLVLLPNTIGIWAARPSLRERRP